MSTDRELTGNGRRSHRARGCRGAVGRETLLRLERDRCCVDARAAVLAGCSSDACVATGGCRLTLAARLHGARRPELGSAVAWRVLAGVSHSPIVGRVVVLARRDGPETGRVWVRLAAAAIRLLRAWPWTLWDCWLRARHRIRRIRRSATVICRCDLAAARCIVCRSVHAQRRRSRPTRRSGWTAWWPALPTAGAGRGVRRAPPLHRSAAQPVLMSAISSTRSPTWWSGCSLLARARASAAGAWTASGSLPITAFTLLAARPTAHVRSRSTERRPDRKQRRDRSVYMVGFTCVAATAWQPGRADAPGRASTSHGRHWWSRAASR